MHPAVLWCRNVAAGSTFLGVAGMILSIQFWWAVAFIYAGLCLFILDLWVEPEFKNRRFWRLSGTAVLVCFLLMFTWGIVLVPGPIELEAIGIPGDYPVGTKIAGINWNPAFSDVRISITNQSEQEYDNLNFVLGVSGYIIQAAVQNENSGCTLMSTSPVIEVHASGVDPKTGKPFQQPLTQLGDSSPRRLQCKRFFGKQSVTVMFAIANVRMDLEHATTNVIPDAFYGPKKMPEWAGISGTYQRGFKPYKIIQKIPIKQEK